MRNLTAEQIRNLYIDFFVKHGHKQIKGAKLIPENDPSVLFTTAGMHPLVPYLLGEPHPSGKRLVNYQKCIRTGDIMDVGDGSHLTFFEMLGNWSLGDYFKEEAIKMSYEFLTSSEYLGINLDNFYVTCFEGDSDCPRDTEAFEIWRSLGIKENHITFLPKKDNWWGPAGTTGPCGPDTEMFIDLDPSRPSHENPGNSKGRFLEIWNDVFMQYDKQADGSFIPLKQKNVDTGLGLERVAAVSQGKKSAYDTEIFAPILEAIKLKSTTKMCIRDSY